MSTSIINEFKVGDRVTTVDSGFNHFPTSIHNAIGTITQIRDASTNAYNYKVDFDTTRGAAMFRVEELRPINNVYLFENAHNNTRTNIFNG